MMKKYNLTSFLIISLATLLGLGLFAQPTQAQINRQLDLALKPSVVYLWVKPGETKTVALTFSQTGTMPLSATPRVVDFYPDSQTGEVRLSPTSSFPHLSVTNPDIQLNQPFSIQPGQTKQLVLSIAPPANFPEGEYLQSVLVSGESTRELTDTGAAASGVIGTNLIIAVSQNPPQPDQLTIEKVNAPRWVDSFWPLVWQVLVKNHGRYAQQISGSTTLTSWRGQTVASYPLATDNVLGFSNRQARPASDSAGVAASNQTDPATEFSYNPSFAIGPHTLKVTLEGPVDDQANQPTWQNQTTQTVIFFPFSVTLAGVLFVLIYSLIRVARRPNSLLAAVKKSITVEDTHDK